MVFFNYALRKLNAKIVYYGPGLCGKTTNLQWIHDHFEGGQRGKMISLATEGDRTIFFDLLPIDIGSIRGMDVTLQLYTVPGQVHYNSTRQLVLRGADGVVFVADSQRTMKSSNAESFENLQENLMLQGIDLKEFPHILQFNKRDLRDLLSPEDLNESLNVFSVPIFEAIATEGIGVQESLEGIVKLVMRNLREKYEPMVNAGVPQGLKPMQATTPAAVSVAEPAKKPAAEPAGPLAPDFVSGEVAQAPPSFEIPQTVAPPIDETIDIGVDAGFAAFQDEDGIATAVYEESDKKIAEVEAALTGPTFPVDEDTAAGKTDFEPEPDVQTPDHLGGLFTDPRDEDGTRESESPAAEIEQEEESEEVDVPAPEVSVDMSTDPEIVEGDMPQNEPAESMDDLFETETPSVKAFIDDVMDVVETEGEPAGESVGGFIPPLVDPPRMAVAPAKTDRYEDRIEAPGPFAPSPGGESKEDEVVASESEWDSGSTTDSDQEMVHDEVRQAFGSSENREALASLSSEMTESDEEPIGFLDDPPEVQPVVPPPVDEPEDVKPVVTDPVEFVDESTPASVETTTVDDFDELPVDPPVDSPVGIDHDSAETVVDELARMDSIIAEPPAPEEPEEFEDTEEPEVSLETEEPEGSLEVEEPDVSLEVEEPEEEPVEDVTIEPPPASAVVDRTQPIMFGSEDPFGSNEVEVVAPEVLPEETPIVPASSAIDVIAEDNQLHVQLKGSGAIAEMGQVRALDIEVPVPGQWVGNRKVTLQLRLTLTPAEDENG